MSTYFDFGNNKVKCGPQNVTRSTKDVLKNDVLFQRHSNRLCVERLRWLGPFPWWRGTGGFKGFCGSLRRERCIGWSSSASAGPGADRRSGWMTGP